MRSDNLAGVMGYLIEIEDLRSHIVYPPRGTEFEPVLQAAEPAGPPPEPKPLWHQEELGFAPGAVNGSEAAVEIAIEKDEKTAQKFLV